MSLNLQRKNSGMLLLVVIGVIGVVFIIFISMVDRVRQESAVTNRVAINERLYQVSSAIGRLAIKKIQKKFELRDSGFGKEIFESAGKTGEIMKGSLTSELKGTVAGIDIIDDLIKSFKDEWGDNGKLDFDVDYSVALIKDGFNPPYTGFTGDKNNLETKGHIDVTVTAKHQKITKKFTIRKEFFLVRLLPGPFYRFTLFAKEGSNLDDKYANNTEVDGTGKVVSGKNPLVCINRMYTTSKAKTVDYSETAFSAIGENNFVNNGWIYMGLGDKKGQVNSEGDRGLILNIPTGLGDDGLNTKFGEYFHFYFHPKSEGWVLYEPFTNVLHSLGYDSKNDISFVYVDYGVFKGIDKIEFPPDGGTPYNLFKNSFEDYDKTFKTANYGRSCFKSSSVWYGSSMRLFGTIKHCTPTIIFGPVRRRYVRTFGFIFTWKGVSRVYAIALKSTEAFKKDLYDNSSGSIASEIKNWLSNKYDYDYDVGAYDDFGQKFKAHIESDSFPRYRDIVPQVLDYEPYNQALHNLCDPTSTDKPWQDVVGKVDGTYMPTPAKRDELMQSDYKFNNDVNLHYNGDIQGIALTDSYMKDRVTYLIPKDGKETSLKNCKFFQDTFVEQEGGENHLFLNQIVEFEGNLLIDQDLVVQKGGMIICDGDITVKGKITNPFLEGAGAGSPDNFGWLSLISRKGNINFVVKKESVVPQAHGFFVAKKDVLVNNRLHIIGGVVTEKMESLVDNSCVIQWGFHPEEIAGGKDLTCRDFYGLAIGPRDIEIITEE
ncbi:MAG: hypothetical protein PHF29_00445 [Candidatus Riflebacteria bacterium]|nr:hypothetical protein [Candidatus Riflebacteria bacterium]